MQGNDDSTELLVEVQSVRVDLKDIGAETYTEPFKAVVDSTLPYLYLPPKLCDWLAKKYVLTYAGDPSNGSTGLYGTSSSQTSKNILNTNSITFALAQPEGNLLTSINFTYESFSALASWSWGFPGSQPIFVMRNMTQESGNTAVLGRAFFQEAYVSANYENTTGTGKTFNISKTAFPTTPKAQIVSIMGERSAASNGGGKLSGGTIAGVVVGTFAALVIVGLLSWFCFFKKQRDGQREGQETQEKQITGDKDPTSMEAISSHLGAGNIWSDLTPSEIGGGRPKHSRQISELSTDSEHSRPVPLLDTLHEMPEKSDPVQIERYELEQHTKSQAEIGELEGSNPSLHPEPPSSPDPTSSSIHNSLPPVQEGVPVVVDESRSS
jgi:hypothetical protein